MNMDWDGGKIRPHFRLIITFENKNKIKKLFFL